ncbi:MULTISPECIES: hypothetical protein [unclassified Tenacibaculum]|uniref:hypothetical protein n=1 Tax=unclassified Tenacibaculum TaxID=2635139 RepID=UPI001F357B6C|nr:MULTISPECIES: hypothetical protein [unclassified Tenacibaculum]MCF2875390.1 hypothetical protein [Tenacibaculum sp. Cn5-1]MCF2935466.1 hypothetical protein [Tenacibaculum sp. Cn5-34]MCG7512026.1 hypothetical protein [Tenacibaculum sp. Cn5-46]
MFSKKDFNNNTVSKLEIKDNLNLSTDVCDFIFETLKEEGEINFLNVLRNDIYITEKGKSSFTILW